MDDATLRMMSEAFDETFRDAIRAGHDEGIARQEAETAAAMFLASMTGMQDDAARAHIASLNLQLLED